MAITKKKLKQIIKEEIEVLSASGELRTITESEKKAFEMILNKLTPNQLASWGLKKI